MRQSTALQFEEDIPDPIEFAEEIHQARLSVVKPADLRNSKYNPLKPHYDTLFFMVFLFVGAIIILLLN